MRYPAIRLGLILMAAWATLASADQVVYQDAFDQYGFTLPGFSDACQVGEYPPSLKHLEYRPAKPGNVYAGAGLRLPGEAAGLTDYEFEFKFRFPGNSVRTLDFRLDFLLPDGGRTPRYASCSMRISDEICGVIGVSGSQPRLPATRTMLKETGLHPLLGGMFYRALVRVQGTRLEVLLDIRGQIVRIGAAEVGGHPLAGFNFGGAAPFDLDDIILRRIPGLPAGDFRVEQGAQVANRATEYRLAIPTSANAARARVRIGRPGEMRIVLHGTDSSALPIAVSTFSSNVNLPAMKEKTTIKEGKPVVELVQAAEPRVLPDAGLRFRELRDKRQPGDLDLTCNIRPWIEGYLERDRVGIANRWETFEAASAHFFTFEVRRDVRGIEYWIDGRYAGRRDSAPLKEISFVLPPEGAIKDAVAMETPRHGLFLPLDISHIANPGALASAKLPIESGRREVRGIPFIVAPGSGNLDLSVVRENQGSFALECDGYLSRTAFSGMPESLMLSAPPAQYTKAYILCAVADDPARDPVITARQTRFLSPSAGGRGPAIADTTLTLPRAGEPASPLPPGVQRLGTLEYVQGESARKASMYLLEVPLDAGKIQDVIFQETRFSMIQQPYLDFEVLGRTDVQRQQLNKEHKPHPTSRSAVHVFAVTLWKPPAELEVVPGRAGSAWFATEKPAVEAVVRSRDRAGYTVAWEARDVDGQVVDSGKHEGAFAEAGLEQRLGIAPRVPGVGHYRLVVRLAGEGLGPLVEHRASFAVVAPDTRKAGYESPYFSWWFNGAHLTSSDVNVVGPLLKMAGIRRSLPKDEEGMKPWQVTGGQLGSFAGRVLPEEIEAKREEYAKKIDAAVARYPSVNAANIFHESCNGGGQFPLELYGIPVPLPTDEKLLASQRAQVTSAILAAELYRQKHPRIRPTLVNTGDSLAGAGMLMRHKFPRELFTAIGEESLGQTMPPETSTAWNTWALRELARRMGYGDVPIDACYEWKGRNIRDLGERRTAAWRQRDALIAHAWGYRMVPLSGTIEPGNSYHNTVWGQDYMFSRSPLNYPYMSFSTAAHLTQVLDGATFVQRVSTGSLTVYALEFERGAERVYALWTARGMADVSIRFDADVAVRQSDMFGRSRSLSTAGRVLTVSVSGEPVYIESPSPASAMTVTGRSYPDDQPTAGAAIHVANAMETLDAWELAAGPDDRLENPPKLGGKNYLAFRQLGQYQLRPASDEAKGACLELELMHEREVVPYLPEYTLLRLKQPAPIPGEPTTVGVWAKGNSGWGQLMWEFVDAQGERWLSCGTGGYGCDVYDWPRQASINFDGWSFVQFPITLASPVRVPGPGEVASQWRSSGGNHRIDYPIRLTGIAVSMSRQALDLTEMKPVKTVIRLKGLAAY